MTSPETSPTLAQLRSATHYPLARRAIRLACTIYILSTTLGLILTVTAGDVLARLVHGDRSILMRGAGAAVDIAGAVVIRELLRILVDLVDGAIDRRASSAASPGPRANPS